MLLRIVTFHPNRKAILIRTVKPITARVSTVDDLPACLHVVLPSQGLTLIEGRMKREKKRRAQPMYAHYHFELVDQKHRSLLAMLWKMGFAPVHDIEIETAPPMRLRNPFYKPIA